MSQAIVYESASDGDSSINVWSRQTHLEVERGRLERVLEVVVSKTDVPRVHESRDRVFIAETAGEPEAEYVVQAIVDRDEASWTLALRRVDTAR